MHTESFSFLCRTKTAFGMNALDHLPFDLSGMGAKKPFVLQDEEAASSDCTKPLARAFMDSDMILGICPPMKRNTKPDTELLKDCYQIFVSKGFDSIIALGTDGVADMAKALNLAVSCGPEFFKKESDPALNIQTLLPFAWLPTGVGSGRETDCSARFKGRVFDLPVIAPDIALIDERIMAAERPDNIIRAALTALSVCAESLVFSGNPMTKAYAATGIGLVREHLFPLMAHFRDGDADPAPDEKKNRYHRACLAHASAITGYLFANSKSLISFDLGHFIAKESNAVSIPPAQAAAIILPHVLTSSAGDRGEFGPLLLSLCSQEDFSTIPLHQQKNAALYHLHNILHRLYGLSFGAVPRTFADTAMEKSAMENLLEKFFQEENPGSTGISEESADKIKSGLLCFPETQSPTPQNMV